MYTFVKIKVNGVISPKEYLVCKDVETLMEYNELYFKPIIKRGIKEMVEEAKLVSEGRRYLGHSTSEWLNIIKTMSDITGDSLIESSCKLEGDTTKTKIDFINNGNTLLLTNFVSYTILYDDTEIIQETVRNTLAFEYNESDIRVIKWPEGNHYYAKIGNIDVVDDYGNQKWDNETLAYTLAIRYLQKYC